MVGDPIADMLARIRNALGARHDRTHVPLSRVKRRVAEILKDEGFISDVREVTNDRGHNNLEIVLKYTRDRKAAIDGIRRISRPGRRVYVGHDKIPHVYSGLGISILSTSSGVMTDMEARRRRVGGEILCEVW
ncbi:MAG: 30S ribosomal protein S8 [Myxococcota bacterium]